MLTPEQRLRQLKAYLIKQKYVQVAYLFGSAARGTIGPLSDVDVAVLLNSDPQYWFEQKMNLVEGLLWIFGVTKVDVVILNKAEPVLSHRIILEGQPIFVRDDIAKFRQEKNILDHYLDTAFLRGVQRDAIKEHIEGGKYFG